MLKLDPGRKKIPEADPLVIATSIGVLIERSCVCGA